MVCVISSGKLLLDFSGEPSDDVVVYYEWKGKWLRTTATKLARRLEDGKVPVVSRFGGKRSGWSV